MLTFVKNNVAPSMFCPYIRALAYVFVSGYDGVSRAAENILVKILIVAIVDRFVDHICPCKLKPLIQPPEEDARYCSRTAVGFTRFMNENASHARRPGSKLCHPMT